jgi:hypothetical protein
MESEGELSTAMKLQLCEVQSDAESTTKVNVHLESGFITPKKYTSVPICVSTNRLIVGFVGVDFICVMLITRLVCTL